MTAPQMNPGIGVDCGISLTKMALCHAGSIVYRSGRAEEILEALAGQRRATPRAAGRIAVTGARARAFGRDLEDQVSAPSDVAAEDAVHWIGEFEAWAAGAKALLEEQGEAIEQPFLLVSLGTGTSILSVDDGAVSRVGGSALGGGCVVGLASSFLGIRDFKTLCELATRGTRRHVDLRLGDVYPDGEIELPGAAVAAHFGKLAFEGFSPPADADAAADLVRGLWGMVADNVGLLVASHAARLGIPRCVIAGSTLANNPCLSEPLRVMLVAHGLAVTLLARGAFTGARGALALNP